VTKEWTTGSVLVPNRSFNFNVKEIKQTMNMKQEHKNFNHTTFIYSNSKKIGLHF